jgi:hypothetical protein
LPIFGRKNGDYLKNQFYDQFFAIKLAVGSSSKKMPFLPSFFGENILKIITSVPEMILSWFPAKQFRISDAPIRKRCVRILAFRNKAPERVRLLESMLRISFSRNHCNLQVYESNLATWRSYLWIRRLWVRVPPDCMVLRTYIVLHGSAVYCSFDQMHGILCGYVGILLIKFMNIDLRTF